MPADKEPVILKAPDRLFHCGVLVHFLILAVACFIAYFNAINLPFVHDDIVFIQQNPHIHRWDNIGDSFFQPSIPQFFQGLVTPYYRPVLEVIYRFEYALFGLNPSGYHLFNIILHLCNGFLFYFIVRRIFAYSGIALLAAMIFLVHPVLTEAVACISGISNIACAFFMLIAFNGYLQAQALERQKTGWFLGSLVAFAAALLTKEQAVVLPLIIMCYDFILNTDQRFMRKFIRWSMFFLVLFGYLGFRHVLFGGITSAVFENVAELKLRVLSVPRLLEMYSRLTIFPWGLHYYRSVDITASNLFAWVLFGVVLGGLTSLSRRFKSLGTQRILFGLAWYVLALLPVLNIIPLVNEYSYLAAAEHNLYVPLMGWLVFLCGGVVVIIPRLSYMWPRRGMLVMLIVVLALIVGAVNQNRYWKSEIVLFRRALEFEPQLGRVHILLAKAYFKEGQLSEAVKEYRLAQQIMERYVNKAASQKSRLFYQGMLKGIYTESAQAYAGLNDFQTAMAQYNNALVLDPSDSFIYSNRALVFIAKGDFSLGINDLTKALELNPNNLYAANNLSICLIQQKNYAKAKEILQDILQKDPNFIAARDNLQRLLKELSKSK